MVMPGLTAPVRRDIARACRTIALTTAAVGVCSNARAASAVDLMRDAQRVYGEGRFETALELYQQAREESESNLSVLYNLAMCEMHLGKTDEAIRSFENVATAANLRLALREDALYNIGVLRARRARDRLDALLHATSQPSENVEAPETQPTAPAPGGALSIDELESVAGELLTAIDFFRRAQRADGEEAADSGQNDTEHNIRACRAIRREVLGLIRQAREAAAEKEKEEALKDPQRFLNTLIGEQQLQASTTRRLMREPDAKPRQRRRQRRVALRLQRVTLDQTATLVDHLQQFRETHDEPAASNPAAPTTQPAQESPREQLYREAARRLEPALDRQRDACAYLLDGDLRSTHQQQKDALAALREAESLFPLDPIQALARWHGQQRQLQALVGTLEQPEDWRRDPWLPAENGTAPAAASRPASQPIALSAEEIPVYDVQDQIGVGMSRLAGQARFLAARESSPTTAPSEPQGAETDPRTDPEINQRLSEILDAAAQPQMRALEAIAEQNAAATQSAQEEIAQKLLDALNLFPKSIEERLRELIARQSELNQQVVAAAEGVADHDGTPAAAKSWKDFGKRLLGQLQSLLASPGGLARNVSDKQAAIEVETRSVEDEVKQRATTLAGQAGGTQHPQVQSFLEASRHLGEADRQMLGAIEELKLAAVEASLNRLRDEGPVQTAQTAALDALHRALEALTSSEQNRNEDENQNEEQQEQRPQARQDIRRAMQRLDRQREQAEQQLYRSRQSRVIKDW